MKIAIYGGTFDPFHSAHKEIVDYLSHYFDRVILVPTNVSYYKLNSTMYSFEDRCKMVEGEVKHLKNVTVSRCEENIPEEWRFVDTLFDFKKAYSQDELYVAIGSDSLQKFKTWYKWEEILKLSKLVVFNRPGYSDNFPSDIPYEFVPMNNPESSTRIRGEISKNK